MLGDLLLRHHVCVASINSDEKVVALHPMSSHLRAIFNVQHVWWLLRRHEPEGTTCHDDNLRIDCLNPDWLS